MSLKRNKKKRAKMIAAQIFLDELHEISIDDSCDKHLIGFLESKITEHTQ